MHPGIKPVSWHVIKSLQFFHKDTKQSSTLPILDTLQKNNFFAG